MLLWQNPLAHATPKLGRCARAASRVGGTGRSASRTHSVPVVGQTPHRQTRRWCVVQQFLGRDGDAGPSPAVPPLIPPGSTQNLATQILPPTPAPAHRATRKFKTINAENPQIQVGFTTKLTIPNLGNMDPNAGGGTDQASGLPPLAWHVLPPYLGVNTATLPSPQFRPTRSAL